VALVPGPRPDAPDGIREGAAGLGHALRTGWLGGITALRRYHERPQWRSI
jgi:hypothetical protein